MKIRLRLFATLQEYLPPGSSNGEIVLELPEDATVPVALASVGVPLITGAPVGASLALATGPTATLVSDSAVPWPSVYVTATVIMEPTSSSPKV